MAALITRRSQLQWLAMLAVAVVLPTVSLLWFMSRLVANERLVIREKLASLYQGKLNETAAKTDARFSAQLHALDTIDLRGNSYRTLKQLVLEKDFQGLVVWDSAGALVYPRSSGGGGGDASPDNPLSGAWQLEFGKKQYLEAAQLYSSISEDADPRIAAAAILGRSRCLWKLGRLDQAIEEIQRAAFGFNGQEGDTNLAVTIANARLLLLSFLQRPNAPADSAEILRRTMAALQSQVYSTSGERNVLPANQNLFVTRKLLEVLRQESGRTPKKTTDDLERLAAAEELSIVAAENDPPFAGALDRIVRLNLDQHQVYGIRHQANAGAALVLLSSNRVASIFSAYREAFNGVDAAFRVLDDAGQCVAGASSPGEKPFAVAALPEVFAGWKVELYFGEGDVFERNAKREIALYIWTGALVILLILIAAAVATRAIGRQIRLNRMKNDFIATVSHELKTPLASMRVLVDTLLEGHIRDEAQANQYLRLAAKENERLSRMIDSFLTFSRMERSKMAFKITESDAAAVVHDAVESVQTKFSKNHCQVEVQVDGALPELHADHDAIVTVLVNLLDNACKYTGPEKRIQVRVFADNGSICFAVSDNGIGIARRHCRKIFDSFYQVDRSLARKAEGCGLGLSIVKFIVDAHKGRVTVESKPGKGSTFSVRIPSVKRRQERPEVPHAPVD